MNFIKPALVIFAVSIFIFACTKVESPNENGSVNSNGAANSNSANSLPETDDELASARKIFKETCAKCHKEDGTGGEVEILGVTLKAENLTSEKAKKEPDEEFIEHITDGIDGEGMPAFKDKLSPQEIKDVVKYIREELQKG
jgi:cytochrome c6